MEVFLVEKSIFEDFDDILREDRIQGEYAIVAMSITKAEVFNRIKPMLVDYLTNPEVLSKNNIDCVPVPKDNDDSKYFYFFEKTWRVPTSEEISEFVFAVADILGKKDLDDSNFDVNEAKECIKKFVDNGWATIVENDNKVLIDAKLENLLLLIRVADHDEQKLLNERDDAERFGNKRRIKYTQSKVDRFKARKSVAGEDKYFDVDDTFDSVPFLVNGIETARLSGAKRVIRDFRHNLHKLRGKDIYDAEKLRTLLNRALGVSK